MTNSIRLGENMNKKIYLNGYYDETSDLVPIYNSFNEIIGSATSDISEDIEKISTVFKAGFSLNSYVNDLNVSKEFVANTISFVEGLGFNENVALILVDAIKLYTQNSIPFTVESLENVFNAYYETFPSAYVRLVEIGMNSEIFYQDNAIARFTNHYNKILLGSDNEGLDLGNRLSEEDLLASTDTDNQSPTPISETINLDKETPPHTLTEEEIQYLIDGEIKSDNEDVSLTEVTNETTEQGNNQYETILTEVEPMLETINVEDSSSIIEDLDISPVLEQSTESSTNKTINPESLVDLALEEVVATTEENGENEDMTDTIKLDIVPDVHISDTVDLNTNGSNDSDTSIELSQALQNAVDNSDNSQEDLSLTGKSPLLEEVTPISLTDNLPPIPGSLAEPPTDEEESEQIQLEPTLTEVNNESEETINEEESENPLIEELETDDIDEDESEEEDTDLEDGEGDYDESGDDELLKDDEETNGETSNQEESDSLVFNEIENEKKTIQLDNADTDEIVDTSVSWKEMNEARKQPKPLTETKEVVVHEPIDLNPQQEQLDTTPVVMDTEPVAVDTTPVDLNVESNPLIETVSIEDEYEESTEDVQQSEPKPTPIPQPTQTPRAQATMDSLEKKILGQGINVTMEDIRLLVAQEVQKVTTEKDREIDSLLKQLHNKDTAIQHLEQTNEELRNAKVISKHYENSDVDSFLKIESDNQLSNITYTDKEKSQQLATVDESIGYVYITKPVNKPITRTKGASKLEKYKEERDAIVENILLSKGVSSDE